MGRAGCGLVARGMAALQQFFDQRAGGEGDVRNGGRDPGRKNGGPVPVRESRHRKGRETRSRSRLGDRALRVRSLRGRSPARGRPVLGGAAAVDGVGDFRCGHLDHRCLHRAGSRTCRGGAGRGLHRARAAACDQQQRARAAARPHGRTLRFAGGRFADLSPRFRGGADRSAPPRRRGQACRTRRVHPEGIREPRDRKHALLEHQWRQSLRRLQRVQTEHSLAAGDDFRRGDLRRAARLETRRGGSGRHPLRVV